MDKRRSTIRVCCTCCDAWLTVDRDTGAVLFTEKPKHKHLSFEDAVAKVQKLKDTADERFDSAFQTEAGRKELVDRKFEEAMKHADELETPINPLDLD